MITKWAKKCKHCNADLRNWFVKHPIWTLAICSFFVYSIFQAYHESTPEYQLEQQAIENQKIITEKKIQENKAILSTVKIVKSEITDWSFKPMLNVTIKNESGKDIDWAKLKASFQNNFKENVYADISGEEFYKWIVQEVLKDWATKTFKWQLSLYGNATIIKTLELVEVHFTDWETITLDL